MKPRQWFRRPAPAHVTTPPAATPAPAPDERVREGADDLQATRQAISDTLTALKTQLEGSRAQWDDQTREAYDRMGEEWRSSLQHMDATIARMRGADEE